MVSYLLKRLLLTCLLLLALLSTVFFVLHAVPGNPVDFIADPDLDAAERELIRHRLGLDRPLLTQYLDWVGGVVLRGDLGTSLRQQRPVAAIVAEALPNTLLLTLPAFLLQLLLAISAGMVMAWHHGRPLARVTNVLGLVFYSLPSFWLGLMLIMVFCRQLGWLPAGGMHSADAEFFSAGHRLLDLLWHLILPVSLVALGSAAGTARYVRNSLLEVLGQDYILAARARGIPERLVLWRHALRNALLPVITLVGLSLPFLLGGTVVTEVVFAWPGMGRVTIEAIWGRDYPVIMATTFLSAVMVVCGSLLADLLYRWADPRVRLTGDQQQ